MPLSHVSKYYGVTDAKVYRVLTDPAGGTTTYGTAVDVPGIRGVTLAGDITNVELRGDNQLLDSNSTLTSVSVTFEYAKLNLDALNVFLGGTVTDAGSTPNQTATYAHTGANTFNYFKFEAITPTNGGDTIGGNNRLILYKCILSSFPDMGFAGEDYQIFSQAATATARLSDNKWFDVVLNETAAALP